MRKKNNGQQVRRFSLGAGRSIAQAINDALNPDIVSSKGKVLVAPEGKGGVRLHGEVVETTERGGTQVDTLGVLVWLKSAWVEDLGDGTIRVAHVAFARNRRLKNRYATRKKTIDAIQAKRAQK